MRADGENELRGGRARSERVSFGLHRASSNGPGSAVQPPADARLAGRQRGASSFS